MIWGRELSSRIGNMYCSNQHVQLQGPAALLKHCECRVQRAYDKDADQTAWMRRLVCPFNVRMQKMKLSRDEAKMCWY